MNGLFDSERSVVRGALVLATGYLLEETEPAPWKADLDFLPQPRFCSIVPRVIDQAKINQGPTDNWFWTVARRHG
jgi:hypothetical protein